MAPFGNITVHWTELDKGVLAEKTFTYNNQDLAVVRPIDIIVKHGPSARAGKGKIWKMRKASRPGQVDDELTHWDVFNFTGNDVTGNIDVWIDLV